MTKTSVVIYPADLRLLCCFVCDELVSGNVLVGLTRPVTKFCNKFLIFEEGLILLVDLGVRCVQECSPDDDMGFSVLGCRADTLGTRLFTEKH